MPFEWIINHNELKNKIISIRLIDYADYSYRLEFDQKI